MALFLLGLAATAGAYAYSGTTGDFLDRCASDEAWCAREIREAQRAVERGPDARKKLCVPQAMTDEGLVGEVTYWIVEHVPPLDHRPHAESIAAALVALYACDRPKGLEGLDQ
jgi:hypothetical protein